MQDTEDEPLFAERVAGLDIAQAGVEVTIRVPSDTAPGRRQQETRTPGTGRQRHPGHILRHGREDGTSWCRPPRSAWHDSAPAGQGHAHRAAAVRAPPEADPVS